MNIEDLPQRLLARLNELALQPLARFFLGLNQDERTVLYVLLALAVALGIFIGRRRTVPATEYRTFGAWRFPTFQNSGEVLVSRILLSHFRAPDYHLMNHVTLRLDDGTTQIDHILVSRFGVFVIETKDYKGWIFANETDTTWTQVLFRVRFKFQNPLLQNKRHVRAVREQLDFLPPDAIKSLVVFAGEAEFKTAIPQGVITIPELVIYLRAQSEVLMSQNRVQFSVGRLETARLAISRQTDVEHIQSLERRRGSSS